MPKLSKNILMRKLSLSIFAAFILQAALVTNSHAKEQSLTAEEWALLRLSEYKHRVRRRIGSDYIVSINSLRNKFLETFDQSDFDGDGITVEDFEIIEMQRSQRGFAFKIQNWLMKDLNRDFKVTKKELKLFYHKQASRSLRSGQTFIRKTREQIDQALEDMILRDLAMDANGDNVVSFEETKSFYEKNKNKRGFSNRFGRYSRYNILYNKQIPYSFDLNNNGVIEKKEYLQVVDQTIKLYNKDKNAILSSEEQREIEAAKKTIRQKFTTKKFWRKPPRKKLDDEKLSKEI
ncbi:hypothetical protein NBRC116602_29620 [Hyphomicrobiales bacterium 4NK60-0047b]